MKPRKIAKHSSDLWGGRGEDTIFLGGGSKWPACPLLRCRHCPFVLNSVKLFLIFVLQTGKRMMTRQVESDRTNFEYKHLRVVRTSKQQYFKVIANINEYVTYKAFEMFKVTGPGTAFQTVQHMYIT